MSSNKIYFDGPGHADDIALKFYRNRFEELLTAALGLTSGYDPRFANRPGEKVHHATPRIVFPTQLMASMIRMLEHHLRATGDPEILRALDTGLIQFMAADQVHMSPGGWFSQGTTKGEDRARIETARLYVPQIGELCSMMKPFFVEVTGVSVLQNKQIVLTVNNWWDLTLFNKELRDAIPPLFQGGYPYWLNPLGKGQPFQITLAGLQVDPITKRGFIAEALYRALNGWMPDTDGGFGKVRLPISCVDLVVHEHGGMHDPDSSLGPDQRSPLMTGREWLGCGVLLGNNELTRPNANKSSLHSQAPYLKDSPYQVEITWDDGTQRIGRPVAAEGLEYAIEDLARTIGCDASPSVDFKTFDRAFERIRAADGGIESPATAAALRKFRQIEADLVVRARSANADPGMKIVVKDVIVASARTPLDREIEAGLLSLKVERMVESGRTGYDSMPNVLGSVMTSRDAQVKALGALSPALS